MGNIREIRARIRSVKNTQQITKTMKMVASAKLRRTQNGLNGIRNFAQRSREILQELLDGEVAEYESLSDPPEGDQKGLLRAVCGQPGPVRRL